MSYTTLTPAGRHLKVAALVVTQSLNAAFFAVTKWSLARTLSSLYHGVLCKRARTPSCTAGMQQSETPVEQKLKLAKVFEDAAETLVRKTAVLSSRTECHAFAAYVASNKDGEQICQY